MFQSIASVSFRRIYRVGEVLYHLGGVLFHGGLTGFQLRILHRTHPQLRTLQMMKSFGTRVLTALQDKPGVP